MTLTKDCCTLSGLQIQDSDSLIIWPWRWSSTLQPAQAIDSFDMALETWSVLSSDWVTDLHLSTVWPGCELVAFVGLGNRRSIPGIGDHQCASSGLLDLTIMKYCGCKPSFILWPGDSFPSHVRRIFYWNINLGFWLLGSRIITCSPIWRSKSSIWWLGKCQSTWGM